MAAPSAVAAATSSERDGGGSGFESWLDGRLEALGVDRAVYGSYILGVLQEEEEEEKLDALQGILSAFLVRSPDTFLYPLKPFPVSTSFPYLVSQRISGLTWKRNNFLSPGPRGQGATFHPGFREPEGCRCRERKSFLLFLPS